MEVGTTSKAMKGCVWKWCEGYGVGEGDGERDFKETNPMAGQQPLAGKKAEIPILFMVCVR